MNNPGRARLVVLLLIIATSLLLLAGCVKQARISDEEMRSLVRADITQVMSDIDKDDSGVSASSNPFDYVGVSPAWQRLVDRGPRALKPIAAEIQESRDNGLREYLLAMAGNAILGPDHRIGFSTAKEWAAQYQSKP